MAEKVKKRKTCRVCQNDNLVMVFTLGLTPLANAFLKKEDLDKAELFYPLDLYFCQNCHFLQLGHVVSPEILFSNYLYVSSTSPVFVSHFEELAKEIIPRFSLNENTLVIDIGSNDGILLKPLEKQGIKVLGIEPANKIAKKAMAEGIDTIPAFFSLKLAKRIKKEKGKAKIISATNVFAHIDDLDEIIKGIKELLTDDGVFIMEAPYLIDFFAKKYFDLVYHEHLSYWSLSPLITLFKRFNMSIIDVEKVESHGGSIRVFIVRNGAYTIKKSVSRFLKLEKQWKLDNVKTYKKFSQSILKNKSSLMNLLTKIKLKNKTIAGFGAPAKGNTLLNYFRIGTDIIDYIVDDSTLKQGLYTPGTHIPVYPPGMLKGNNPDYLLILAWNFASSIIKRNADFVRSGGKFIIPVPYPKIINSL